MPSRSVMGQVVGQDQGLRRGCKPQPSRNEVIAQIERLKAQILVAGEAETAELDAQAAEWFAAGVQAWAGPNADGASEAYASTLGCSRQHVDAMMSGKKSTPLRALLPLLQSREAVRAFVTPLCLAVDLEPPQPKRALTPEQVVSLTLSLFAENPVLLAALQEAAAERHGAEPEETLRALRERL
jgi:hypothetical protein